MQQVRSAVEREFDQVNELIIAQLESDVDMVENVGHYIVDAGGKRLRPLLVLLCAKALGPCSPAHVKFAAVVEFIHTATLLHDDVVDLSSLRRGKPTANAEFGTAPSILVGDFLYTRAFQLMVQLNDMGLLDHMADTTNTIAEGEVLQLVRAGDAQTSAAQYLEVISRKTAILFGAACFGAGRLAGADTQVCNALHSYGLNLGIAFQMIDDVLDYDGDAATMGKNVGDDLTEGKPTLPLIHCMSHGTDAERELLQNAITEKRADQLDDILAAVRRCGSLDYTREQARGYHDKALLALDGVAAGSAKDALQHLAALSIDRDH
ncbi:MAG: polyprenyl synthetase family protein [Halioglobus sp.]